MAGNGLASVEDGEAGEASTHGVMVSGDLKGDAGTTEATSEVTSAATKGGVGRKGREDVSGSRSKGALVEASGTSTSGRKSAGPGCLAGVASRETTTEAGGTRHLGSREDVSRTAAGS